MHTASCRIVIPLAALALACPGEVLLHGLDEPAANEAVVALAEAGIGARKVRAGDADRDAGYGVEVAPADAARAQRLLAANDLPRPRPPGFGEVFGRGGLVPTATEEHALYLHALSGELSRSLSAIDGVVGARVHLALPAPDPLRPGDRPPPRAAVLLRCRPAACARVRGLQAGIQALVAGAADRMDPAAVAVVVTEATLVPAPPPRRVRPAPVLLALAGLAAAGAVLALAAWERARRAARGAAALEAPPVGPPGSAETAP